MKSYITEDDVLFIMPQSFLGDHLSLRRFKLFFFFGDTLTSACRMTSVSRLKRWRWHGNAVARAPALVLCGVTAGRCYERHRCAGGSCWQERMHRQGWQRRDECVCVCVCVCAETYGRNSYTMWGVCVCSEVCLCVFACRKICTNTCQHVCVCVCVCVWHRRGQRVQHVRRRLCGLLPVGSSEHRHSDETKHATCWAAFAASRQSAGRSASIHIFPLRTVWAAQMSLSAPLYCWFSTTSTRSFNLVALPFLKISFLWSLMSKKATFLWVCCL